MNETLKIDPDIAFGMTFIDIGKKWKPSDQKNFYFDRYLRYAASMPSPMIHGAESVYKKVEESKRPVFPDMTFGLIDTIEVNGFAKKEKHFERYHAGLSVPLVLGTVELACYYFSFSTFFKEIGNVEHGPLLALGAGKHPPMFQLLNSEILPGFARDIENSKAVNIANSIDVATQFLKAQETEIRSGVSFYRAYDTLLEFMQPRCPVRRMHSEYLSSTLVHFLWIHEISHITQGHLTRINERTGNYFTEYSLGQFSSSLGHSQQEQLAMEFDADIEAVTIMMGLILHDLDIEDDDAQYTDQSNRVSIFVFGIVAFYNAMASEEARFSNLGTHPPSQIRLENILVHLAMLVSNNSDLNEAIMKGVSTFQDFVSSSMVPWAPKMFYDLENDKRLTSKKWKKIYDLRFKVAAGYRDHKFASLRVFLKAFDLEDNKHFSLMPEPDWWE